MTKFSASGHTTSRKCFYRITAKMSRKSFLTLKAEHFSQFSGPQKPCVRCNIAAWFKIKIESWLKFYLSCCYITVNKTVSRHYYAYLHANIPCNHKTPQQILLIFHKVSSFLFVVEGVARGVWGAADLLQGSAELHTTHIRPRLLCLTHCQQVRLRY